MWIEIRPRRFLRWSFMRVDMNEVQDPPKSSETDDMLQWAISIVRSMAARCAANPLPDDWQIVGICEASDSFALNIIIESREFAPLEYNDIMPEIIFTMIARPLA